MRGGQEHRDLSFEQLRRYPDDFDVYDEETYYEYFEFISKNNQHRFKDINSQNKVVKAYANVASRKCLVRILDLYRQKVPSQPKAFYLRPLTAVPKDPLKPWFINSPVGVNTLKNVMSTMSKEAGLAVVYSNHSLRATSTSRMYSKNLPEKLIAEKTGHRSLTALRLYERTTTAQEKMLTRVLNEEGSTYAALMEEDKREASTGEDVTASSSDKKKPVFSGLQNCVFNFY